FLLFAGIFDQKDFRQLKHVATLDHKGAVLCLAMSPTGKFLISGGDDPQLTGGMAVLWDVEKRMEIFRLTDFRFRVFGVSFSPDGKQFATASGDGKVILWKTSNGKKLTALQSNNGFRSVVFVRKDLLATRDFGEFPRYWDLKDI